MGALEVIAVILLVGMVGLSLVAMQFWKRPGEQIETWRVYQLAMTALAGFAGLILGLLIRTSEMDATVESMKELREALARSEMLTHTVASIRPPADSSLTAYGHVAELSAIDTVLFRGDTILIIPGDPSPDSVQARPERGEN